MNKKLISLITSVSMCIGVLSVPMFSVNAGSLPTVHDVIVEHFEGSEPVTEYNIKLDPTEQFLIQDDVYVPTDMQVKKSSVSDWKNGYFNSEDAGYVSTKSNVDFDYKTTMYMKVVKDLYDKYITLAKYLINGVYQGEEKTALLAELDNTKVVGQYVVTVIFDNDTMYNQVKSLSIESFEDMFILKNGAQTASLDKLYKVVSAEPEDGSKSVKITIQVNDGVTAGPAAKKTVLDTYLNYDIAIEKDGLTAVVPSDGSKTYVTIGTVTGYTDIMSGADKLAHVNYIADQKDGLEDINKDDAIAATVKLVKSGNGGSVDEHSSDDVTYDPKPPIEPPVEPPVEPPKDVPIDELPEGALLPIPDVFETSVHYEYIIGYPDDTVRPFGNITREEVATIFYRMLKAMEREDMFRQTNDYSDVERERWSNNAISTLSGANILLGYKDGTFRPANPITRAEFVTVATRFYQEVVYKDPRYTDIQGHWAEEMIKKATYYRLIEGYSDGTFRPDANITRAEVMTIVNKMLNRNVDDEGLIDGYYDWIDNRPGTWYYYTVIEATTPHNYERREPGYVMENWTSVNGWTDWKSLELVTTKGDEVSTEFANDIIK